MTLKHAVARSTRDNIRGAIVVDGARREGGGGGSWWAALQTCAKKYRQQFSRAQSCPRNVLGDTGASGIADSCAYAPHNAAVPRPQAMRAPAGLLMHTVHLMCTQILPVAECSRMRCGVRTILGACCKVSYRLCSYCLSRLTPDRCHCAQLE